MISGGINALLAGTGRQINGLTKEMSRASVITVQVILGGSASLMGMGYSAISNDIYSQVPNSNKMILVN